MDDPELNLAWSPIVEAVLDLDCDLPPAVDIVALEKGFRDALRETYPKLRVLFWNQHTLQLEPEAEPKFEMQSGVQAYQFLSADEHQIVQIRQQGYTFNRLEPYSTLDDYLREIERTWQTYVGVASPIQMRSVRLRYINRLLLPFDDGRLELEDYLRVAPQLPDDGRLTFIGFLEQHRAMDSQTDSLVEITLASEPIADDHLPVIFDIAATKSLSTDPQDWSTVAEALSGLRGVAHMVFIKTLTEKCLNKYRKVLESA